MKHCVLKYPFRYEAPSYHWFCETKLEGRVIWRAFSVRDSAALEKAHLYRGKDNVNIVSTDGGRYDVNLSERKRNPVYWDAPACEVRRCSWFHKGNNENYFTPFEEHIADILECEYRISYERDDWFRVAVLLNGDTITFNGPYSLALSCSEIPGRTRAIKRGIDDEFDIKDDESETVEHLIFAVHGIGPICDLKLRTIEEVVDIFRDKTLKHIQQNKRYRNRIEVLPINWHYKVHRGKANVDRNLQRITLPTMPLLRNFTNDTLVDILLYISPTCQDQEFSCSTFSTAPFSQIILETVSSELTRLFVLFKKRHPTFCGEVSLLGHSLGSVILFDLLLHQKAKENVDLTTAGGNNKNDNGQIHLKYPQLPFRPIGLFTLGSPIALFLTVRGVDMLGVNFKLPTCPTFVNIFHPCDPVAYRIEPLICAEMEKLKPAVLPHYGSRRSRIKNALVKVTASAKQTVTSCLLFLRTTGLSTATSSHSHIHILDDLTSRYENLETKGELGMLNKGRRIDYALQGSDVEFLNEYVCGITSHACYWDSDDVILYILEELCGGKGRFRN
ncbi:hypothetical protein PPYR_01656 [Photinus pyralis]|uniref:DDHD domain-containing protein n=1 Tax=Photinus pyralis TaxID=7054 RepID=A0A5N4B550_PHOPY|nr:hypothetical protein PPYR_01656 [Photinus pyralis]